MKHYVRERFGLEFDVHHKFLGKNIRPKTKRWAKTSYRKRERRALNNATRELVASY